MVSFSPAEGARQLALYASALARELDDRSAHLAGIGVGGMVAQIAARATAELTWDRTPGIEPSVQLANQLGKWFVHLS